MNTVFERTTKSNQLLKCTLKFCVFNDKHEPSFFIDGKEIKKKSAVSVKITEEHNQPFSQELYNSLKEHSATHCWNCQVFLYADEAEKIEAACKAADEDKEKAERALVAKSDIKAKRIGHQKAFNGCENNFFEMNNYTQEYITHKESGWGVRWQRHGKSPRFVELYKYDPVTKRTNTKTANEETANLYEKFVFEYELIKKWTVRDYEKAEFERVVDEARQHDTDRRKRLGIEDMTVEQVRAKERAYDNIHNEGEEGYNPYRDL